MSLFEAVQKFLMYLTITRGMSPKTVEQYGRHIWAFLCFLHPEARKIVPKSFDLARFYSLKVSTQPEGSENPSSELEKIQWIKTQHVDQDCCDNFRLSLAQ